jgi:hypothetical protein
VDGDDDVNTLVSMNNPHPCTQSATGQVGAAIIYRGTELGETDTGKDSPDTCAQSSQPR